MRNKDLKLSSEANTSEEKKTVTSYKFSHTDTRLGGLIGRETEEK